MTVQLSGYDCSSQYHWNYSGYKRVVLTCTLSLQNLPADAPPLFVTLNPTKHPAKDKVLRRLNLAHPQVSAESTAAQLRLPSVQVCPY